MADRDEGSREGGAAAERTLETLIDNAVKPAVESLALKNQIKKHVEAALAHLINKQAKESLQKLLNEQGGLNLTVELENGAQGRPPSQAQRRHSSSSDDHEGERKHDDTRPGSSGGEKRKGEAQAQRDHASSSDGLDAKRQRGQEDSPGSHASRTSNLERAGAPSASAGSSTAGASIEADLSSSSDDDDDEEEEEEEEEDEEDEEEEDDHRDGDYRPAVSDAFSKNKTNKKPKATRSRTQRRKVQGRGV